MHDEGGRGGPWTPDRDADREIACECDRFLRAAPHPLPFKALHELVAGVVGRERARARLNFVVEREEFLRFREAIVRLCSAPLAPEFILPDGTTTVDAEEARRWRDRALSTLELWRDFEGQLRRGAKPTLERERHFVDRLLIEVEGLTETLRRERGFREGPRLLEPLEHAVRQYLRYREEPP